MALNTEQEAAVRAMAEHCMHNSASASPFFILKGPAGTGKTYCMTELINRVKRKIVFTAPTNKAVKVLRESIKSQDYKPECRTIYSLLGLQMLANGEVKELSAAEAQPDLSEYAVVVVDEGSMVNKVLRREIELAAEAYPKLRWIFMGDKWQLPPVGEDWSEIWEQGWPEAELTQIMRQDNQILKLSAHVRQRIESPFGALTLANDNDKKEGVWTMGTPDLEFIVAERAKDFQTGTAKFIAWRNLRVDHFNKLIRGKLFAEHEKYPWQPGDRVTMLGPILDLLKEDDNGRHPIVATTDEEGVVEKADLAAHPIYPEFTCWRILWRGDFNSSATLWVLAGNQKSKFDRRVAELAATARGNGKAWKQFWDFKDAFHPIRHAYAITAHRAQGSTYEQAYVNWRDVLLNQNRTEAYRCLYVAVTRPKKELYLG